MRKGERPFLSIVVACRNEKTHIRGLLESILEQQLDGIAWEAVIADGMSDDGSRNILDQYCREDRHLHLIENRELIVSTGLNRAIRVARGEIILRMDAHTRYAPDYSRRCIETLVRTQADNVGGPARTAAASGRAQAVAAAYHSRFSTGGGRFHDPDYEGWVDTVPYGCWRKTTLERIGLFDEDLVRNQDDELNLRLRRLGGRIWQARDILSWYSPRPSLHALFHQYFQYGFWKVAVIRKHRLPGSWRHIVPCAFIFANAVLPCGAIINWIAGSLFAAKCYASAWLTLLLVYAVATLAASVAAARRSGWSALPYLPGAFVTFHIAYGLGFLIGVASHCTDWSRRMGERKLFTRITR